MGKISNFTLFFGVMSLLAIIVITGTVMKINDHHEERLLYALDSKIKVHAKRCYLENKCTDTVTLEYLYNNKYLDELINPVTKEIIDKTTEISYVNEEIIINWK